MSNQREDCVSFDENDLFQCGKCKRQFHDISEFVLHKRQHCQVESRSSSSITPVLHIPSPVKPSTNLFRPVQIATSLETISNSVPPNIICNDAEILSLNGLESSTFSIPIHSLAPTETFYTPVSSSSINIATPLNVRLGPTLDVISMKALPANLTKDVVNFNDGAVVYEEQKPRPDNEILKYDLVLKFDNENQTFSEVVQLNEEKVVNEEPVVSCGNVETKTRGGKKRNGGKKFCKLQCNYCEKGFSKKFDLEQHVRSHTGEKPFQCLVCGRAFAQRSNVKKHMQTHKVWPVEISHTLIDKCKADEEINDSTNQNEIPNVDDENLLTHSDGFIDISYTCQFCDKVFTIYRQLRSHLSLHKNEQVYKCIVKSCSEVFKELDTFLEHIKTHESDMNYQCHICSKVHNSLSELSLHQYVHRVEDPHERKNVVKKRFSCYKCQNKYSTLDALDHHWATCSHNFRCPYCDKIYLSARLLRRHLLTHNSISSHKCTICGKNFRTEHYLRLHSLIHTGDKPFHCIQCDASFNRKDKLKRHVLIHEPVKRFKCPFRTHTGCTKEFHRPDKLKAHIVTHNQTKPYQCCFCKRTFSRSSTVKVHIRQAHKENDTHCCTVCRQVFENEERLMEHECIKVRLSKNNKSQENYFSNQRHRKKGIKDVNFNSKLEELQEKNDSDVVKLNETESNLNSEEDRTSYQNLNNAECRSTIVMEMENAVSATTLLHLEEHSSC